MHKIIFFKIIFFVLMIFTNLLTENEKIKLYTFCTPSHEALLFQWFLPTLQDDFELIIEKHRQECPSALIRQEGWGKTMLRKVDLILRGIKENWNKVFIYADIDIQFIRPIQKLVLKAIINKDIVFQRNNPLGEVCAGFLACRGNEKTLALWKKVRDVMIETNCPSDQITLNKIIQSDFNNIIWDYFPSEFFGAGTLTGERWKPGDVLLVPARIVLHHANYTNGVKNKIDQLIYVRNFVNNLEKN